MKDKVESIIRFFSRTGVRSETPYVNGKIHGYQRGYYFSVKSINGSDQIKYETPFIHDEIIGIEKSWNRIGGRKSLVTWSRGRQWNGVKVIFL